MPEFASDERKGNFNEVMGKIQASNHIILIKGAGEKASAIAHRLHRCDLKRIVMTECLLPTAERRGVCFSKALCDRKKEIFGVTCERSALSKQQVHDIWNVGRIAIIDDPDLKILEIISGISQLMRKLHGYGFPPFIISTNASILTLSCPVSDSE